jgi:hypothetical protein
VNRAASASGVEPPSISCTLANIEEGARLLRA